jgi:hypothetical protein
MPLTPFEIIMAKVWAMGLVVVVATASIAFVVQGLLEVPIEGSIGLFVLGMAVHLLATTSVGIFLGTVARSMPQMGLLMLITLLPLQMLSGGYTPRAHARTGARHHAGRADHPFRVIRTGHSLPRGRFQHRLAAVSRPDRDRQRLFRTGAEPLPQNYRLDGLIRVRNHIQNTEPITISRPIDQALGCYPAKLHT